jgi:ABC-2 type transport system ATP-binding protein
MPTSGSARVLGLPPGDVRAHRKLGFLPEHPTFYDYLTAEELLTYFAGLFGYSPADCRTRASSLLDRVGLAADRQRPLRQYSKGMIQRVGLAQSLVNDPELVIFDEPMSGLDPVGRRDVRELILQLRDEGRTVLFSSHILSDAELLCSRVAILAKGRLVAGGSLAELTAGTARGWDVVAAGVSEALAALARARGVGVTAISDGRYSFALPVESRPEPFVAEIAAAGGAVVSVAPVRTTLEDIFMERVQ